MNLFNKHQAGTIISIPKPPFTHYGILGYDFMGKPFVISNSFRNGKVVTEPFKIFCSGYKPQIHNMWGRYNSLQVINRAKELVGTQYSASRFNCEHFVRHVHGLAVESPQYNIFFNMALAGGMAYLIMKNS